MADKGPNYDLSRKRLALENEEHELTIFKGEQRINEIERSKRMNLMRVEMANDELDSEADRIRENNVSLRAKISDNDSNLKAMVKAGGQPNG